DTYHVDAAASHRVRQPLITALDRLIGADDLVAFMTPEMSPRDMAFARKMTTIDGMLTRYWPWGERDAIIPRDPEDEQYGTCYPNQRRAPRGPDCTDQNGLAAEMIDRRREKRSVDALRDLVQYLRGVREERKAVIAITNGWLLYRPNMNMMRPLNCHPVPSGQDVGIDPRNGRPTSRTLPNTVAYDRCDVDRINLAQIDADREFHDILDEANRANASFYPIDPRGLAVFDTPMIRLDVPGPSPALTPPAVDRAMLTSRLTSLRTLAESTDGLAIVDSNDLNGGFQRIVADLSSYYLLGYYSNGKLDGRFHAITVRVKRPGVQVRARRGYLAASSPAVETDAAPASADAEAAAIGAAIAPLADYVRELPLRVQAATGWKPGATPTGAIWVVGELGGPTQLGDDWKSGGVADAQLLGPAGTA